jgi:hypothetical protein
MPDPLNILIFGHSDTFGVALPDRSAAWPNLVGTELPERIDRPVVVNQRPFLPLRPGAGASAQRSLDQYPADIAVFATNPYGFAVTTVANRVQKRFGDKTAGRFKRLEYALNRWTARIPAGKPINTTGRRIVRRVIGTASASSYEDVLQAHMEVLRTLARKEDLQVIIMGGNRLAGWIQRERPDLVQCVETMRVLLEEFCEQHHFAWFNTESALLPGARERSFLPDGAHRNAEAHRHFADLVLPVMQECAEKALAPA